MLANEDPDMDTEEWKEEEGEEGRESHGRKLRTSPAKRNGMRIRERTYRSENGVHIASEASVRELHMRTGRNQKQKWRRKWQ